MNKHAQTEDGRWTYDLCIIAFRAQGKRRGPCGDYKDDPPCTHRPKLKTPGWAEE